MSSICRHRLGNDAFDCSGLKQPKNLAAVSCDTTAIGNIAKRQVLSQVLT